jgi:hypothetical protein
MTARSLAVNTFTYPREQMVRNVLGALKAMRESIIARQLGADVALSAEELEKGASAQSKARKQPRTHRGR